MVLWSALLSYVSQPSQDEQRYVSVRHVVKVVRRADATAHRARQSWALRGILS